MKKTALILVLALAVGFSLAACKPKTTPAQTGAQNQPPANTQAEAKEEAFSGSVNDLMARGVPSKCTYNSTAENVKQSGVVYIQGKNANTYMETEIDGKIDKMHVLKLGDWQYMWTEGEKQGSKFMFTEEEMKQLQEKSEQFQQDNNQSGVDLDSKLDYKCVPWVPNSSVFAVPTDVTFQDLTQMMKQSLQQMDQIKAQMCQACGMMSGQAKTDCLKACQ